VLYLLWLNYLYFIWFYVMTIFWGIWYLFSWCWQTFGLGTFMLAPLNYKFASPHWVLQTLSHFAALHKMQKQKSSKRHNSQAQLTIVFLFIFSKFSFSDLIVCKLFCTNCCGVFVRTNNGQSSKWFIYFYCQTRAWLKHGIKNVNEVGRRYKRPQEWLSRRLETILRIFDQQT